MGWGKSILLRALSESQVQGMQGRAHLHESYSGEHGRARFADKMVRHGAGGTHLPDLGKGETAIGEVGAAAEEGG